MGSVSLEARTLSPRRARPLTSAQPAGTDATIAEHISKIIEREYVMKQREGATEYLVPSTLGIGLVEGYNAIGFDKSLSKPHLRRLVSFASSLTPKNSPADTSSVGTD